MPVSKALTPEQAVQVGVRAPRRGSQRPLTPSMLQTKIGPGSHWQYIRRDSLPHGTLVVQGPDRSHAGRIYMRPSTTSLITMSIWSTMVATLYQVQGWREFQVAHGKLIGIGEFNANRFLPPLAEIVAEAKKYTVQLGQASEITPELVSRYGKLLQLAQEYAELLSVLEDHVEIVQAMMAERL